MNTQLLREDEKNWIYGNYRSSSTVIRSMAERLIEEREVSAHYLAQLTEARLQIVKLQAELGDGIH